MSVHVKVADSVRMLHLSNIPLPHVSLESLCLRPGPGRPGVGLLEPVSRSSGPPSSIVPIAQLALATV